jgi:pSer/pThr/pTyr-binding forkhead associated (FHA) protein
MDRLVVQVVARSARSQELTRSNAGPIKIGRGFGNDVVLADPFVAPEQIVIERAPVGWTLRVLDETNDVLHNGVAVGAAGVMLDSGDRITVGRTDLEVYDESHRLEPTRKLPLSFWVSPGRVNARMALGVLAGVTILDACFDFFQLSTDLEWHEYAYASLSAAVIILVWTALWSVAGRVLRHQSHFWVQLLATLFVYLGLILLDPLFGLIRFVTGSVTIDLAANSLLAFIGLVVLLRLNLFFATNVRHTLRAALVISAMAVGLTLLASQIAKDDFEAEAVYSNIVRPPFMHLVADRSIDEFLAAAALEAAR